MKRKQQATKQKKRLRVPAPRVDAHFSSREGESVDEALWRLKVWRQDVVARLKMATDDD